MTICVCVKVNECMVFAADSASSFDGLGRKDAHGDPIQQVYRYGNKVFNLHRQLPIMAMTSGLGNFGLQSIAMLAKDFRPDFARAFRPRRPSFGPAEFIRGNATGRGPWYGFRAHAEAPG